MSTPSVLYKVRRILGDWGSLFTDRVGGDGVTQVFELSETTVEPTSFVASLTPDGQQTYTALTSGTDYTLDPRNGVIIVNTPPADNEVLVASGVAYDDFTDEDLLDYMRTALAMHTTGRPNPPVLDAVPGAAPPTNVLGQLEERPVALLAARLATQDLATSIARDITIDTGDGTVIPRSQRYAQLVQEAARLDAEYVELVQRLGLPGMDEIEAISLRRVSPTTGRLVPVYKSREWDDRMFPERVLPYISSGALPTDRLIRYVGQFVMGRTYQINDLCDEGGVRYLCLAANTNVDPHQDVQAGDGWHGQHWEISYINAGMFGWATGAW